MLNMLKELDLWLDSQVDEKYLTQPLAQDWARVAKVCEEAGEAIQALIGATGQNPRKGVTCDMDDVLDELADVILTGYLAIQHFTHDIDQTADIVAEKVTFQYSRMLRSGYVPPS
jgi:NTP pyrophosphatase (non-canonical NTP hydrolase)